MRLPSWRLVRPERANPKLSPEPLSGSRSDVLRSLPGSVATMPFLDVNAVENDPEGITFLRAVIGGTRASGATPSWKWKAVAIAPALLPQALTSRPRFVVADLSDRLLARPVRRRSLDS